MAKGKYKYHYFYKIINLINNHFYYGIHSTNNLDDGYMGSGSRLHHAYKKYGIENFKKEILKYFDTREELAQYEADVVTEELVLDENCYNISCGGEKFNTLNSITVKDKNNNCFRCKINDPKWINGEYESVSKNMVTCFDNLEQKYIQITKELFNINKNRYSGLQHGKVIVSLKGGNKKEFFAIDKKDYDKNIYETVSSGKIVVKDKNGKIFIVSKDDERYKSGKLQFIQKGKKHSEETKQKMHETHLKNNHQQGEKNSQFGTCWIHNNNENKKIKKEQLKEYISNGWIKGRKMKLN